jgi:4-hydroxyphenylpyruvate dioxygenase
MKKSIATVSLPGKLREKLEAIAAAGFDGVEIFEPNLKTFDGSLREVGQLVRDLGLTVEMFQPLRDFEGVRPAQFQANLDRAEVAFDTMSELEAPLLLVCANTGPEVLPDAALMAAQLGELADRAARRGLRVGYEALAWSTQIFTFEKAFQIVKLVNNHNLGLILDSFHTLIRADDWSSLATLPGGQIAFLQVGDARRIDADYLTQRRHHSRLPGEGDLDVAAFVRAAMATGYAGPLSLEIFNEASPESPAVVAVAAKASLAKLERLAR